MKFLSKEIGGALSQTQESQSSKRNHQSSNDFDELNAFLGQGCTYKGKLAFEGAVRIDGRFSGEIISDGTLIIGETAQIKATIEVAEVIVCGSVKGDILASTRLELRAPAKLIGNVSSPSLFIEEGVVFEGQCRMISSPESKGEKEPPKKMNVDSIPVEVLKPPKFEPVT